MQLSRAVLATLTAFAALLALAPAAGAFLLVHVSDTPGTDPNGQTADFGGASADASRVLFRTTESMLASDGDDSNDIYARNNDGSLTHITDTPGTDAGGQFAFFAGASADGTRAFFKTSESLLASDGDNEQDVYARNNDGRGVLSLEPDSMIPSAMRAWRRELARG